MKCRKCEREVLIIQYTFRKNIDGSLSIHQEQEFLLPTQQDIRLYTGDTLTTTFNNFALNAQITVNIAF